MSASDGLTGLADPYIDSGDGAHQGLCRYAGSTLTLTGALTLSTAYANVLRVDPGGAGRAVTLPTAAEKYNGAWYRVYNVADADEDLTVDTSLAVVQPGEVWDFYCDGSQWRAFPIRSLEFDQALNLDTTIDQDVALAAAGAAQDVAVTIDHATAAAYGVDSEIAQLTTVRTGGVVAAYHGTVTSLAADTGGDFAVLHGQSTDGGGTTPTHSFLYTEDAMDHMIKVAASGDGGVVVSADGMTADPETAAEAGYISIAVGATGYQIPIYGA